MFDFAMIAWYYYTIGIQAFFVIIVKILFYLLTFVRVSILIIGGIIRNDLYICIFYLRGNAFDLLEHYTMLMPD